MRPAVPGGLLVWTHPRSPYRRPRKRDNQSCNTWWQYDGQEHLVYEYPGSGDTTTFALNAAGDVTSQQTGSTTTPSTYVGHRLYTQRGSDGITMRFIYDAQGNLACKVPDASWPSTTCPTYATWPKQYGPLNLESYSYDYKNRLTSYHQYNNNGDLLEYTSYSYDALDRTVSKTENHCALVNHCETAETTTTNSSYEGDSSRVIEENLVSLEKKTYAYDAFGSAISLSSKPNSQAPASRYSYLYDPGSSVSLLVDSSGAVEESYGYSAYGSSNGAISKKASGFSTGSVPTNPVRFQGKMFDSGSGAYDMGARRYSASAGRWLSQDVYNDALDNLGLSQDPLTANRYAFLGANPVNYVEVDGHSSAKKPKKAPHPNYNFDANFVRYMTLEEGYRTHGYDSDGKGNCTIGIGHYLHAGACTNEERNTTWTKKKIMSTFWDNVADASAVRTSITRKLSRTQYYAVVALAFNVGAPSVEKSQMLKNLNAGNNRKMYSEWNWECNASSDLLCDRRAREKRLFRTGRYPWQPDPPKKRKKK